MSIRKGTLIDPANYVPAQHWYRQGNVIAWFDRRIRLWTAYAITAEGYQAGPAQYYPNAGALVAEQGTGALDCPLYD